MRQLYARQHGPHLWYSWAWQQQKMNKEITRLNHQLEGILSLYLRKAMHCKNQCNKAFLWDTFSQHLLKVSIEMIFFLVVLGLGQLGIKLKMWLYFILLFQLESNEWFVKIKDIWSQPKKNQMWTNLLKDYFLIGFMIIKINAISIT